MKKSALLALSLVSLLQACSQKSATQNAVTPSSYQNKIVLGKFVDTVSYSSINLSAVSDLPKIVDLKADMSPVKNQGDRGTCTFFSTMGILEAAIKKDEKIEVNLSEEYLNHRTKLSGYFADEEGSNVWSNIQTIDMYGVMLEKDSVYQPSWFQKGMKCAAFKADDSNAPAECYTHNSPGQEAFKNIINTERVFFNSLYKNTNNIIRFLAEQRRPLTMSITVNFNGWPDTGDVFYNEELREECNATPSPCGGHSIVLTGYDMNKKVFFFKNSWGHSWGNEGYGTITFDTVDQYVEGPLYYASVAEISIPENHADIKIAEAASFNPQIVLDNTNLKVVVTGELKKTDAQVVYLSSFLSKKPKSITAPADETNTTTLALNSFEASVAGENIVRGLTYILPTPGVSSLVWDDKSPVILDFDKNAMSTDSVKNLLNSNVYDTFLRTTVYSHNDIDGFKILKRIYQKVK